MGDKILPATYEIQLQAPDGEALSDIVALRVDRVDSDATKRDFVAVRARSAYLGKSGIACQLVASCVDTGFPERMPLTTGFSSSPRRSCKLPLPPRKIMHGGRAWHAEALPKELLSIVSESLSPERR